MNKFFIYLFCFLTLCSSTMQATEDAKDAEALKGFERLIMTALPLASSYDENLEEAEDEKRRLTIQGRKQNGSLFASFPEEVILRIFGFVDSKTLSQIKFTCHYFNAISTLGSSSSYLNTYCLTEPRPLNIPNNILQRKTKNTQGGIFLLAACLCESSTVLSNQFDLQFLEAAYESRFDEIPQQLNIQNQEELGKLYPILKIALTLPEAKDRALGFLATIQELYNANTCSLSFNQLRLLSLVQTPDLYCTALMEIVMGHGLKRFSCSPDLVDFMKRELLLKGRNPRLSIATMNNNFFVYDDQKKEIAIQIIEWCTQNFQLCENSDYVILAKDALHLERFDLTKVVFQCLEQQPRRSDSDRICLQVLVFNEIKDRAADEDIRLSVKKFAHNLYSHWGELFDNVKLDALSLMIWAEKKEDVENVVKAILSDHVEGDLNSCPSCLFKTLSYHHYSQDAEKVREFCITWDKDLEACTHAH